METYTDLKMMVKCLIFDMKIYSVYFQIKNPRYKTVYVMSILFLKI